MTRRSTSKDSATIPATGGTGNWQYCIQFVTFVTDESNESTSTYDET
jgi:hypothetical protein